MWYRMKKEQSLASAAALRKVNKLGLFRLVQGNRGNLISPRANYPQAGGASTCNLFWQYW
jgi:hypothetical protein